MWSRRLSTVLIVAGESAAMSLKPAFLVQPGLRVVRVNGGDRVVETAQEQRPQVIVQEIDHPAEGALRVARELKTNPETSAIPLIAVVREDDRPSVLRVGVEAMVNRPLILREYWDAVARFVTLPRRRALRESVNLRFCYTDSGHRRQAFSRDLSPYGAFLKTDQQVTVGSRIRVQFSIPGDPRQIDTGARIRHAHAGPSQTAGFAIEFEGMEQSDQERLERFVERSMQRAGRSVCR